MSLTVPDSIPDDTVGAAIAYANAGIYIAYVRKGTKNPGSVLGKQWQTLTTRDPEKLVDRLAASDHGIAAHCGRSGLVVLDVDHPDLCDDRFREEVLDNPAVPFQSTRDNDPRQGHYVFEMPAGRQIGNPVEPWGEVRGQHGVIMLAPSYHPKIADGGRYEWKRTGPIPVLPAWLAERWQDSKSTGDTATDAEVAQWLAAHPGRQPGQRPGRFAVGPLRKYREAVNGDSKGRGLSALAGPVQRKSRHVALLSVLPWACKEINAGQYGADVLDELHTAHRAALADPTHPNGAEPDRQDWAGSLAWAIAQAKNDRAVDGLNPPVPATTLRAVPTADELIAVAMGLPASSGSPDTVAPDVPRIASRVTTRREDIVTTATVTPIRQNRTGMPDRATMAQFDWFWDALPENRVICDYARAWRLSPWAVYLSVLARFSLTIPPNIVGAGVVAGPAPLNLFAWITGESGAGKGTAMNLASQLLDLGEPVDNDPMAVIGSVTPGSGEAISHLFKRWPKVTKAERAMIDKGDMAEPGLEQYRRAVHMIVPEVTRLESLSSRPGGMNLLTEFCQAWSGERFGTDGYVDKSKCIPIAAHSVRLSATVGCQPSRMGGAGGKSWWEKLREFGFTQRGIYAPAIDPLAPDRAGAKPHKPLLHLDSAPLRWTEGSGLTEIGVAAAVAQEIDVERLAVLRGEIAIPVELSHQTQNRFRLANLMTLVHDRLRGQAKQSGWEVTERYWELAGVVMAVSEETRLAVVDLHRDRTKAGAEQAGALQGIRDIAATDTVHADGVQRASRWVLGYLERKGPTSRSALRQDCNGGRVGPFLADAVGKLIETGQIVASQTDRGEQYARK